MSIYCVYLTIYKGNKLPIFYIGSTSVKKIELGYHGSVSSKKFKSIWKQELKTHPELFVTKIISKHILRDEATEKESSLQMKLRVHKNSLYTNCRVAMQCKYSDVSIYNRTRINPNLGKPSWNKGKTASLETRLRQSISGKAKIFSESHKQNLSLARKNVIMSDTTCLKISNAQKGKPRLKTTGAGNGRSKSIVYKGIKYESYRQCSLLTGASIHHIKKSLC
jgi:hypothetical protein